MADFEKHLKALEQVVEQMERGDLTLDDSVKLFEEGVKLSSACKKELEEAEAKIEVLVEQGNKMIAKTLDIKQGEELISDDDVPC